MDDEKVKKDSNCEEKTSQENIQPIDEGDIPFNERKDILKDSYKIESDTSAQILAENFSGKKELLESKNEEISKEANNQLKLLIQEYKNTNEDLKRKIYETLKPENFKDYYSFSEKLKLFIASLTNTKSKEDLEKKLNENIAVERTKIILKTVTDQLKNINTLILEAREEYTKKNEEALKLREYLNNMKKEYISLHNSANKVEDSIHNMTADINLAIEQNNNVITTDIEREKCKLEKDLMILRDNEEKLNEDIKDNIYKLLEIRKYVQSIKTYRDILKFSNGRLNTIKKNLERMLNIPNKEDMHHKVINSLEVYTEFEDIPVVDTDKDRESILKIGQCIKKISQQDIKIDEEDSKITENRDKSYYNKMFRELIESYNKFNK